MVLLVDDVVHAVTVNQQVLLKKMPPVIVWRKTKGLSVRVAGLGFNRENLRTQSSFTVYVVARRGVITRLVYPGTNKQYSGDPRCPLSLSLFLSLFLFLSQGNKEREKKERCYAK